MMKEYNMEDPNNILKHNLTKEQYRLGKCSIQPVYTEYSVTKSPQILHHWPANRRYVHTPNPTIPTEIHSQKLKTERQREVFRENLAKQIEKEHQIQGISPLFAIFFNI